MFSNISVKAKIILLVVLPLFLVCVLLSYVAISQSNKALINDKFAQLTSIQKAKKSEIKNYFKSLEDLLVSLATQRGTKDAFIALKDGFYNLENELEVDIDKVKIALENDFKTNYLNNVKYNVPNSNSRKEISEYLPKNKNALIAQYAFITDNHEKLGEKNKLVFNDKYDSSYMQAHKKYHSSFDKFLTTFELYDIFIADLDGNLIYTDFKEKDFATNLKDGVYSNTGIANAYNKALKLSENKIAFEDFAPYEPSYNSSASFIATPIFINGIKEGVLIFQMPVDKINNIMNFDQKHEEAGLGKSGETYLIADDYKMRTNSRFQKQIEDEVVKAVGSTIGIFEIKTQTTKNLFENNQEMGQGIILDYRGVEVLSSFETINIFNQAKWALVIEEDYDESVKEATNLAYELIIASIIIFLIMIAISIIAVKQLVIKPIDLFTNYLDEFLVFISYKKNRLKKVTIKSEKNEFSEMIEKLNLAVDDFDSRFKIDMKVIGEIVLTMDKVEQGIFRCRIKAKTANPLLMTLINTINKMLESLEDNMIQLENVTNSYTNDDFREKIEISKKLKARLLAVMQGVNALGDSLSSSAKDNLTNGQTLESNASIMKSSMHNLASKASEQAASLEETSAAIEEITSITRNNAQNASKMSTLGQTVKDAVIDGQKLASKTASSMEEINSKVTSINEAITVIDQIAFQTNILSLNAAVEAATAGEAGKGFAVVAAEVRNLASRSADAAKEIKELVEDANIKANEGKVISDNMIKGYETLNNHMGETIKIIDDVSSSSKEQMTGIEQINDAITMLDRVTQENASEANQITNISNEVSSMAHNLVTNAQNKQFN
ncbi:MAG: methyl-accepting chemotaxis protein [Poseidonibacter sp.]